MYLVNSYYASDNILGTRDVKLNKKKSIGIILYWTDFRKCLAHFLEKKHSFYQIEQVVSFYKVIYYKSMIKAHGIIPTWVEIPVLLLNRSEVWTSLKSWLK